MGKEDPINNENEARLKQMTKNFENPIWANE